MRSSFASIRGAPPQVPKTLTFAFARARRTLCSGQTVSLTGMLVLVACAPAFPNASPHDVYHSFPALFCAGDSRIVERSFVTLFRRSRVAM
ncbi:hypothetical protein ACOCG7_15235 [Paraburkholderia sp. DD10]|jgi:hypothetical protein|uniref:hypothetical protein n=1 Tax=Paraburkholderia TaxID=1822464 RepID=UPI00115FE7EE|nr:MULTISPECIES: hypothetical protein [Paraburkholderia]